MSLDLIASSQAQKEVTANALFVAAAPAMLFALKASTTSGLTFGYYGGNLIISGTPTLIADGTLTLTNSATNYIEVTAAGVVSSNTTAFTAGRTALYTGVAVAGVVTYTDKRTSGVGGTATLTGSAGGDLAGTYPSPTLALGTVHAWTKNQSVTFNSLTDGATISTDASLSNNFRVTIAGNRTLANPTNLTDGMVLNFYIKQDATGSRTLAYGTAFKFPGGAPTLTTTASAKDLITCVYDGTDAVLLCNLVKAFA